MHIRHEIIINFRDDHRNVVRIDVRCPDSVFVPRKFKKPVFFFDEFRLVLGTFLSSKMDPRGAKGTPGGGFGGGLGHAIT